MPKPELSVLYVTAKDLREARVITRTLLQEKLAACTNILPGIESLYRWGGKLTAASETAFYVKTTTDLAKAAMARIAELHSADCPCIIELTAASAHPAYASWIEESVR